MKIHYYAVINLLAFAMIAPVVKASPSRDCKVILHGLSKADLSSYSTQKRLETYKRAIEVCANEPSLRINYGLELVRARDYAEAERQLIAASDIKESLVISKALGYLYYKMESYPKSELHYRQALTYSSADSESIEGLARALEKQGKSQESEEVINQIAEEDLEARHFYNQALAADQAGRSDEAEELYLKAIALDPSYWRSFQNLGRLKVKEGEYEKGREYLKKALALNPGDLSIAKSIASSLWKEKLYEEYETYVKAFIQAHPEHAQSFTYSLGSLYLKQKKFRDAEQMLRDVVEQDPSSKNLTSLAWAQIEQKKYEQAKDTLNKAIDKNSENALAYNNLGVLYQRMGELKKAKEAFTYAVRRDPSNAMYKRNLDALESKS